MKNKEKETITQRKSNKSVKTAVLLFGAVLLTTSLLGGTLAKYTGTIGEASDTARAAKWDATEEFKEFDLFASSYVEHGKNGEDEEGTWTDDNPGNNTNTVQGENATTDVIAPGTKGKATIEIDTTTLKDSEVAYQYTYTVDDDSVTPFYKNGNDPIPESNPGTSKGWNVLSGNAAWLPLKFKVTKAATSSAPQIVYDGINGSEKVHEGNVQVQKVREELEKIQSDIIYPNMGPTEKTAALNKGSVTIEWVWPFEQQMDEYDTKVGINAAGTGDMIPNFKIKIAATKTQVD